MKPANTIRILTGLSLLLFICPFFQMCSDEDIPKMVKIADVPPPPGIDTATVAGKKQWEDMRRKDVAAQKAKYLEEHRDEAVMNAYKIAYTHTRNGMEMTASDLRDPYFYFSVCFVGSIVMAFAMFIMALLKKTKTLFILSCINIALIIAYSILLFGNDMVIKNISQIKYGYYLFVLNSLALVAFTLKEKRNT